MSLLPASKVSLGEQLALVVIMAYCITAVTLGLAWRREVPVGELGGRNALTRTLSTATSSSMRGMAFEVPLTTSMTGMTAD